MTTKVLKQLDFAKSALGENLLAEYIGDFLDSNTFVRLVVHRCAVRGKARQSRQSRQGAIARREGLAK